MPDSAARMAFPRILRMYMDQNRMNQSDIAEKLHVSKQTVSDWINGKKFPRVDKMQQLADLFGVLMSDMYTPSATLKESVFSMRLDPIEVDLVTAFRNADDRAREDAMKTLMDHPWKKDDTSAI